MRNPWIALPTAPPFVLEEDRPHVDAFNRQVDANHYLHCELLPEPFVGDPKTAAVIYLQRNPGFGPADTKYQRRSDCRSAVRSMVTGRKSEWPFLHLDPRYETGPGGEWWRKRLRSVLEAAGSDQIVAKRFAAVEYHGYHSRQYAALRITLPSQHYTFELVRLALRRGALIVVGRGDRDWRVAIPELDDSDNVVRVKTARSAYLTDRTLAPRDWQRVLAAVAPSHDGSHRGSRRGG
jgi:hypothetical protein